MFTFRVTMKTDLIAAIVILLVKYCAFTNAYTKIQVNGVRTLLALENETISVECETNMPMAYCGFIHPSGKRFSFSGSSLIAGRCAIRVNATKAESGEWNCHIGSSSVGLESKQKILVRVVDKLAAVEPNMSVVHKKQVTLRCVSTQRFTPLSYCRFEPPSGSPFSISPAVTEDKAILGHYFFPPNMSLDGGDCAVTVRRVRYEDRGAWTCAAGLDDGNEYVDVINLVVKGYYTMSPASVIGTTLGGVATVAFLIILGVSAWKKKTFLTGRTRPSVQEITEALEMAAIPVLPEMGRTPFGSQRTIPSVIVESPSEPSTSIGHEH